MMAMLLAVPVAQLVLSAALGWMLARNWSGAARWRVALAASAPVPLLLLVLSLLLFVQVMLTPADQCGVDACGMAMMAAADGLFVTLILWLLGLLVAALAAWLSRRSRRDRDAGIFD